MKWQHLTGITLIKTLQGAGKGALGCYTDEGFRAYLYNQNALSARGDTGNCLYWAVSVLNYWIIILYFFSPKNSEFHSGVEITLKTNKILL